MKSVETVKSVNTTKTSCVIRLRTKIFVLEYCVYGAKIMYQGGVEPPVMAPEAIAVSDWLLVHNLNNTTKNFFMQAIRRTDIHETENKVKKQG